MDKLIIAAALFALGLWIWSEYFRAIPNLEQAGVLKNFQVESIEPHQAEYRVLAKQYYGPERRGVSFIQPVQWWEALMIWPISAILICYWPHRKYPVLYLNHSSLSRTGVVSI